MPDNISFLSNSLPKKILSINMRPNCKYYGLNFLLTEAHSCVSMKYKIIIITFKELTMK